MHGRGLYRTVYNIQSNGRVGHYSITPTEHTNTLPNLTLMRYTHAQLTTVDRYVPINSDIAVQELSGLTLMMDSSVKRRCPDN